MLLFIQYLEETEILNPCHHGGLKGHSPEKIMSEIQMALADNMDNDKISVLLSTDLLAAYDTFDHSILLQKCEYFGISDKELTLF